MSTAAEIVYKMNEAEPTVIMLRRAVSKALELRVAPVDANGKEYYVITIGVQQAVLLDEIKARADWKNYYRSVRILRRIRQANVATFQRFSRVWYDCSYKAEIENIEWPHPPKRTRSLP
ncbi:MAG: hypothetical protein U1A72_00770 [Sulfuritalea sp.]|nr:hypothetical protein [Sulfuritalea sp.]